MTVLAPRVLETTTLVGLLTWTYQRQKADIMSGKGLWAPEAAADEDGEPVRHWSTCGCAQVEAVAALGCDVRPGGWQNPALHPDAETVHDLVVEMSAGPDWLGARLLRQYGRQGGTPGWGDSRCQRLEPVLDGNNRPVADRWEEFTEERNKRRQKVVRKHLYCPVQPYPPDEWFDLARGEYRAWYRALETLAGRLEVITLNKWRVVVLGAEAAPWERAPGSA